MGKGIFVHFEFPAQVNPSLSWPCANVCHGLLLMQIPAVIWFSLVCSGWFFSRHCLGAAMFLFAKMLFNLFYTFCHVCLSQLWGAIVRTIIGMDGWMDGSLNVWVFDWLVFLYKKSKLQRISLVCFIFLRPTICRWRCTCTGVCRLCIFTWGYERKHV